jgi:glyoxylase I family protein
VELDARFDHVSLLANDLEVSLRFYVDVLGFEQTARPDLGFPGAWLRLGSLNLHLVTPMPDADPGAPPGQPTGFANHLALAVSDYEKTFAALRRAGYDVRGSDVGIAQMFLQDPAGNVVELVERADS